jgi:dienelactone hydrolase
MAEVVLFHHVHGQTAGFLDFAERLREAGHSVHTPDIYDGKTFAARDEGAEYAERIGLDEIVDRGISLVRDLPVDIVYAGFSLGTLPAQALAQTRSGSKGALLYHGASPESDFDCPWPAEVPLQMHTMEEDELVEIDVMKTLAVQLNRAELFLYPGAGHLFADPSQADYDAPAAELLWQRTLGFLDRAS